MKSNDEKVTEVMNQLSTAFSDAEVKKYPELKNMIFESATQLNKNGDVDLVATKLCKKMTLYYLSNKDAFPKAAIILFNQLKNKSMKYDSTAAAAMLMPLWF